MSQNNNDNDQSELPGPIRTVTSDIGMHPNSEMNVVGLVIFAGLFVLALPLLPLIVIGWVVTKITSRQGGD